MLSTMEMGTLGLVVFQICNSFFLFWGEGGNKNYKFFKVVLGTMRLGTPELSMLDVDRTQ